MLLAQALISNYKILILDEPAANLDQTARTELLDELIKIKLRDMGKIFLIWLHLVFLGILKKEKNPDKPW
ncbi:hypothetical protein [Spiroplasma endosymbiont of Agriotes lineatus]|uniref:hypothetical protein n=1 Tax=Spiroplasma endosymbiont of Agriotes lineatus TaxID=3077930 RepID=UPI0030CC1ED3